MNCHLCSKLFTRSFNMQRHIYNVHKAVEPFKCYRNTDSQQSALTSGDALSLPYAEDYSTRLGGTSDVKKSAQNVAMQYTTKYKLVPVNDETYNTEVDKSISSSGKDGYSSCNKESNFTTEYLPLAGVQSHKSAEKVDRVEPETVKRGNNYNVLGNKQGKVSPFGYDGDHFDMKYRAKCVKRKPPAKRVKRENTDSKNSNLIGNEEGKASSFGYDGDHFDTKYGATCVKRKTRSRLICAKRVKRENTASKNYNLIGNEDGKASSESDGDHFDTKYSAMRVKRKHPSRVMSTKRAKRDLHRWWTPESPYEYSSSEVGEDSSCEESLKYSNSEQSSQVSDVSGDCPYIAYYLDQAKNGITDMYSDDPYDCMRTIRTKR